MSLTCPICFSPWHSSEECRRRLPSLKCSPPQSLSYNLAGTYSWRPAHLGTISHNQGLQHCQVDLSVKRSMHTCTLTYTTARLLHCRWEPSSTDTVSYNCKHTKLHSGHACPHTVLGRRTVNLPVLAPQH